MYMPSQNFLFINTEEDAHAYIVPPNNTVLLMCRQKPIFFIKSADSLGQYTLDRYSFKKEPLNPNPALPDNVITKDQFEAFKEEIRALLGSTSSQHTPQEGNVNDSTTK